MVDWSPLFCHRNNIYSTHDDLSISTPECNDICKYVSQRIPFLIAAVEICPGLEAALNYSNLAYLCSLEQQPQPQPLTYLETKT